jgi:hypothetical protein
LTSLQKNFFFQIFSHIIHLKDERTFTLFWRIILIHLDSEMMRELMMANGHGHHGMPCHCMPMAWPWHAMPLHAHGMAMACHAIAWPWHAMA